MVLGGGKLHSLNSTIGDGALMAGQPHWPAGQLLERVGLTVLPVVEKMRDSDETDDSRVFPSGPEVTSCNGAKHCLRGSKERNF